MEYMRRALALAHEAAGTTSPNPAVGAVVVKDGHLIAEGATLRPGQDHAERVALRKAGAEAKDASLYVTLEPCCIHGLTPPCTGAIVESGIKVVHAATLDPNPKVDGRGIVELREAGIEVHLGEGAKEADELYEGFSKFIKVGLPFVTAKYAMSLDGKIATGQGDSQWITGPAARRLVHQRRRASDAIMVGVNTVLRDNPRLTARDDDGANLGCQPLRVVVDGEARTPPDSRLLSELGRVLIATLKTTGDSAARLEAAGAEVLTLPERDGYVDLERLLEELGRRGVVNLLVEGGGTLLGSLFDQGLVDKTLAFIAPVIIGGRAAPSPVEGRGAGVVAEAIALRRVEVDRVEGDLMVKGYPEPRS